MSQSEIKPEPRDERDLEICKNNFEERNEEKKEGINFSISKIQEQVDKNKQEDLSFNPQMAIITSNSNPDLKHPENKDRKYFDNSMDDNQDKDLKPPVLTPSVGLPIAKDLKESVPPCLVPMGEISPHLLGSHISLAPSHYAYPFSNPNRGLYVDKPPINIPTFNNSTSSNINNSSCNNSANSSNSNGNNNTSNINSGSNNNNTNNSGSNNGSSSGSSNNNNASNNGSNNSNNNGNSNNSNSSNNNNSGGGSSGSGSNSNSSNNDDNIDSRDEPQNLKIKQEIIQNPDNFDPIQNLKDLKVPGQSPTEPSKNSFLPGPSIENIKKEPENYQTKEGKIHSPPMGLNQDGTLQNNPNLRVEREKDAADYSMAGIEVVNVQEKEERDIKPLRVEDESHTPPLPPVSRTSTSTPPVSGISG